MEDVLINQSSDTGKRVLETCGVQVYRHEDKAILYRDIGDRSGRTVSTGESLSTRSSSEIQGVIF